MSKKRSWNKRRKAVIALGLLSCFIAVAVVMAHRGSFSTAPAPVIRAPQGQPPALSREYIYAGSRLIATEQTCGYAISPACGAFSSTGAESSFLIAAAADCSWTVVSNASWITISSEGSGTGNATINFIVRDNTTGAGRQGTISIAGLTFSVTQTGVSNCAYAISPANATLGPGGGTGTFNVTATTGCAWQAVSNNNWITISSGGCGLGNGTVGYSVTANTTGATRTGTITVNGQVFAIKQTTQ